MAEQIRKNCMIFGASPDTTLPDDFRMEKAVVICADNGWRTAESVSCDPDIIVGDFDSSHEIPSGPFQVEQLPVEKDDTDVMAAVRIGLDLGCRTFRIYGALGGRFDHSIANLSVLQYLHENGACGTLEDADTLVMLADQTETVMLYGQRGKYVSVFPFGMESCRVSYQGLKYPMHDGLLEYGFPLGVSNQILEEHAEIRVTEGLALIIVCSERE